jgi:hypothetical protein
MAEMMTNYEKSPIPPEKPRGIASERHPDRSIGVDDRGRMAYGSAAAEGMVEIVLPTLPRSPNGEERMLAKDFGVRVAGEIERSMKQQPYLKSGPQKGPAEVFRHYAASAKGYGLMDSATIGRMEKLAAEFEAEPDQQEYFEQVIRPYLLSLMPKRR